VYDRWHAALATAPGSPLVRAYLDLSLACRRQPIEGRDDAIAAVLAGLGDVPLLQYRAAICGGEQEPARLAAVRDADADFVDADLELGRIAVQNQVEPDFEEGLRRLTSARAAFPESPVIPSLIAALYEAREEWPEALETFDAVLALVPTHRDALLGRTISLSHLSRYEDAVTAATRLIDLGNWFIGRAYYWRAWNEFQLKKIADARADADRAKALMVNAPTFVLSGLIEWVEKRLDSAEGEFQSALDMDYGQCDAAFYLGGVRVEQRSWPESLAAYQHAQQCFELSVTVRREAIAKLSATAADMAAHAREIASHERAIAESEKRRAESAQNVAAIERFIETTR
jgi:tetratricopeptide (TPR) repeat protein